MASESDIQAAKPAFAQFPTDWEGKQCVREMKEANYNWKQMEWWAFYFELQCRTYLGGIFQLPGERFAFTRSGGRRTTVRFDAKRDINWDLKAKAIKADDQRAILNDQEAMDFALRKYGEHGLIIAQCDVVYDDENRTFQKWHAELKGGRSKYEVEREQRTNASRYRKTHATLIEILFLVITPSNVGLLDIHRQGRNSNGTPRPPKYMLDLEKADKMIVDGIAYK